MSGVPFARPDITEREIAAVTAVLRSGWLTTGPVVKRLEIEFAARIGVARAIALNSGTAALHLALEAAGVGPNDEVIVPTFTFTASAEVVRYVGAHPVFVDVRPSDLTIDPVLAAAACGPRTKAIIGVDIAGVPCAWDALSGIARERGIVTIDDAAHALPATLDGRLIGTWADLTAFSFYVTKTLATGEGGMLVTDRAAWADRAVVMSLHGISHDAWDRYAAGGRWAYEVIAPGYKYNLTDVAAALGEVQLARLDEMCARRSEIAARYAAAFGEDDALEPPSVGNGRESAWQLYILRLRLDRLAIHRAAFIDALADRGVGASVHFIPLHRQPYWRDTYGLTDTAFPVASREYERVVSLPIYSAMSDADVAAVIAAVREVARVHRTR